MQKIVEKEYLSEKILELKKEGKIIVLTGGCFDVLHTGHIEFLNNAKKQGNILVVMLESDETLRKIKGENRPINNQQNRAKILSSLNSVDFVICISYFSTNQEYNELVKTLEPDIIAVTKGDPLFKTKKEQAESIGGRVIEVIERKQEYSTTDIVKNIK